MADKHYSEYKTKPQAVVEVPGVIKFVGAYAEDCKGQVFCATDSRRVIISASKRSDSQVFIKNSVTEESKHFAISSLRFKKEDRWANYTKALITLILKKTAVETGINLLIDGDVSEDTGVAVGILLAVDKLLSLGLSKDEMQDTVYKAFSLVGGEKKTISEIQAILFAKENHFMVCNTNTNTFEYYENPFVGDVSLLVADSAISIEYIKDLFEDVAFNCTNAMKEFNHAYHRDSFINMMDSDFSDKIYPISSETRQVCTYLYDEYKSVLKIKKFIKPLDPVMIGTAFAKVQRVISDKLEITCPEIEWIIKRANEVPGCFGCTSILSPSNLVAILIKTKDVDSFLNKIEDYEHIFGLRVKVSKFIPNGCAKVVSNENSVNKR